MDKKSSTEAFGSGGLWLPKGSIVTRVGFNVGTDGGYQLGGFAVETRSPRIYAAFLSQHPDFEPDLLNIIFGQVLGSERGPLGNASFREMTEQGLVSRLKQNEAYLANAREIGLYTRPSEIIGRKVTVSNDRPTLYRTDAPVLVDYQQTLLI